MLILLVNDCHQLYQGGFQLLNMQPHRCGHEESVATDWCLGYLRRNETCTGYGSGLKYRYTISKVRSS